MPATYLKELEANLKAGNATEHTHRPALKALLEGISAGITATNEPKRSACGAPDFEIARRKEGLILGYVEAKDTHVDLATEEKTEQLTRYRRYLPNLLFTNGHEFRWYVDGKERGKATLATLMPSGKVNSDAAMQAETAALLKNFLTQKPIDIATAEDLAKRLAHFTHLVRDIIVGSFANSSASPLVRGWREAFALTLLPELAVNLDPELEAKAVASFADMLAQTLAYGLFSARSSAGPIAFTREKAQKLIPSTNPFLRDFFYQITGPGLDDEPFAGFVEDIIQTLAHSNMDKILDDFGRRGPRRDPMLHFYETFLQAYDPKLRELRGVYYTPEPVVNYIVESVDHLLKDRFGFKQGLADTAKVKYSGSAGLPACNDKMKNDADKDVGAPGECHRVLILDPATGTATFLYRIMDFIREKMETGKKGGQWSSYVHEHLLPRLFGFELLMAPYAIAHFKLGLALAAYDKEPLFRKEWAYAPHSGERLNIFLTNTLEDLERTTSQLPPLQILSNEANAAYEIKKHKPVLCIIGNPPYSGHSANKGAWISKLVRDYYQCDGKPLGERNPKWLQDDYVKFIRWSQWRIDQSGQGILAFITNHGYLDNPTFRGMRQSLMSTFDEIFVLDLHGNSKKKERVPGTTTQDKNVFDIQQGVAIGIFVKHPPSAKGKSAKKKPATVKHAHLWSAQRKGKYEWLDTHQVESTEWTTLKPSSPHYWFIPQDHKLLSEYETGWKITEMMPVNVLGFQSHRDDFANAMSKAELEQRFTKLHESKMTDEEAKRAFQVQDSSTWKLHDARKRLRSTPDWKSKISEISYRPFDNRWCYYDVAAVDRPRTELLCHVAWRDNLCLSVVRQTKAAAWHHAFVSTLPAPAVFLEIKDGSTECPLYLYPGKVLPQDESLLREDPPKEERRPNFSMEFIADLMKRMDVTFTRDGLGNLKKRIVGPEAVFNYAYAVFHSPAYRARYAEFLRTDFPRLPLTRDFELFSKLVGLGGHLVDLHARGKGDGESIGFPIKGEDVISEVRWEKVEEASRPLPSNKKGQDAPSTLTGRVWINDQQYFDNVPQEAWEFPIGGYLPAQRWLKDRKGRQLHFDELVDWPRIVNALHETGRLMREIDVTITKHGGFPGAFAVS